jgi:predicted GNAT family acetyltransferase
VGESIEVADVAAAHRYEARRDGELVGFIDYKRRPDTLVLVHTEVLPQFEGQGIGSALIRATLDDVRRHGGTVAPLCPFVAAYLRKHPDQMDLVSARYRDSFAAGVDLSDEDA